MPCFVLLITLSLLSIFRPENTVAQPLQPLPEMNRAGDTLQSQADFGENQLCPPPWNPFVGDKSYSDIRWNTIDRRCEEGWWHLYPFGERYFDAKIDRNLQWHDQQIDLDFLMPFYGFRFNYTFIFPEGFVAFSYPRYIQPPYSFPNRKWPYQPDPSLVATFLSPQSFMFVGNIMISQVWHRLIHRPPALIRNRKKTEGMTVPTGPVHRIPDGRASYSMYGDEMLKATEGRVDDPAILDRISWDVREGQVGANGFVADYALIVTWERMAYGGAPKSTRLDMLNQVKRWQNTYQMVLATDEIRTYCMFNYANINWTSSTASGSLAGRGGVQSGVVGFNGGNGTGFFEMPYSSMGDSYKLYQYGSTPTAGRWQARIDENIRYGGCTNATSGPFRFEQGNNDFIGGFNLNVSGPCFMGSSITIQYEELTIKCRKLSMTKAICPISTFTMYTYGPTFSKLSTDGGRMYNFYKMQIRVPQVYSRNKLKIIDDPVNTNNNWLGINQEELSLKWNSGNLSSQGKAAKVDIVMYGYWEDMETNSLEEIGVVAMGIANTGKFTFKPEELDKSQRAHDAFRKYRFGVLNIRVSGDWKRDNGMGSYFTPLVPFGWYFKDQYRQYYGSNWPLEMCKEWYDYDGQLYNFWPELEEKYSCPCTVSQMMADRGRFMPEHDCDYWGNNFCPFNPGALACWISVYATDMYGAGQRCCYDDDGWLMFTHDYERDTDYIRFYSASTPMRAHIHGHWLKKRPPFLVGFSNYFHDKYPLNLCCNWANHCEFYFWRRESSGCQNYRPGSAAFAYGCGHFQTFDNVKYTFPGNGYFVLSRLSDDYNDLMIQLLMEQPPKTDCGEYSGPGNGYNRSGSYIKRFVRCRNPLKGSAPPVEVQDGHSSGWKATLVRPSSQTTLFLWRYGRTIVVTA